MKFIFFNLIILITAIDSIKIEDYCFKSEETECSEYDFTVECGKDLCTRNKYACNSLSLFSSIAFHIKKQADFDRFIEAYRLILFSIKECTSKLWQPDDLCLKGMRCFYKQKIPHRLINKKVRLVKYLPCMCIGDYKHQCSHSGLYCAKSKYACSYLNANYIQNGTVEIKRCDNFDSELS